VTSICRNFLMFMVDRCGAVFVKGDIVACSYTSQKK